MDSIKTLLSCQVRRYAGMSYTGLDQIKQGHIMYLTNSGIGVARECSGCTCRAEKKSLFKDIFAGRRKLEVRRWECMVHLVVLDRLLRDND